MNHAAKLVISSVLISLTSGCATSQKVVRKEPKKPTAKASQVESKAQAQVTSQMNQEKIAEDLAVWVARMSSANTTFTIRDRQYVASMPISPKPGSLAEAALVVGILRDIETPPGGKAFKEVDLKATGQQPSDDKSVLPKTTHRIDEGSILEHRAREKGVDVIGALAANTFLKSAPIFSWAWNASLGDGNSEIFRQNLTTVIRSEALLWQEIARKSGPAELSGAAKPAVISDTAAPAANQPTTSPPADGAQVPPSGAPLAVVPVVPTGAPALGVATPATTPATTPAAETPSVDANKAMGLAQDAAASENYAKAVEEASKIPVSSPLYGPAQESIRLWSNRGVTDLRKKAAFDYRSASSVTDNASKKSFLLKAKSNLDDAIKKYPAATNLDTVRDNLGMINADLERLK